MKPLALITATAVASAGLFVVGFLTQPVPRPAPVVFAIDNPEADASFAVQSILPGLRADEARLRARLREMGR